MRYAIGIDLGGSKIEGVLINEKGKVLKKHRLPTEASKGYEHILTLFETLVKELSIKPIEGVGISMPGYITSKGKVACTPNLAALHDKPLPKTLKKRLQVPLIFENDANCFLIAEHRWGAAKGKTNVIGIILGTGVGGSLLLNGKIYTGTNNGIELGHIQFPYEEFDVEHLVSGPGISRRYAELTGDICSPKEIFSLKNKNAKQVQSETIELVAWLCGMLINTYNPQMIIFGGGVSKVPLYTALKHRTKKYALPNNYHNCKIMKNSLGDSSGVLGAASLFF